MERKTNRHHVFYEGRLYRRAGFLNRLRTHPGLIIPINIYDHRDLHQELRSSVPVPERDAVEYFLQDVILPFTEGQPRTRSLDQAIGWFAMTGNEATAEHLQLQREFILRTPIGVERAA